MKTSKLNSKLVVDPLNGEVRSDGVLVGYALNSREYTPIDSNSAAYKHDRDNGLVVFASNR